jgi:hypothetical protein
MSSSDVEEHNKAASEQVQENNKHNGKNNNKKEQQLTKKQQQQAIERVLEKSKENKKNEKIDKKKEQPVQPPQTALTTSNSQTSIKKASKDNKNAKKKPEPVKKEDDKHNDEQQAKKKTRKVYIDPEFAANPFKLLLDDDDEEEEFTTETDDEESNHDDEETNSIIEKMSNMEIASKNNKKSKDEPKNVKKQAQNQQQLSSSSQQNVKNDKNLQKKQQVQHVVSQKGKIIERQDSVTSATSSNNSKDSKQLNKNNKKLKNVNEPPKSYVQSFPLHPQYQPTVYKPTDYVKKPTISAQPSHQNSNSIMDQLNRGIRVEGLRLPPGITLTKVAPTNEAISTKRDSINRITQPMQDYGQQSSRTGMDDHMVYSQGRDPNGIIMVESNPHAAAAQKQQHQMQHQQPNEMNSNAKKKNKKKKSKGDGNDGSSNKLNQQQSNGGERMVTLKNPMFFNNNNSTTSNNNNNNSSTNNGNSETMMSMMRNLQTPPFISPMNDPQQASIIKNENGMYTIRNPAFQNAFGAAGTSSSSNSGPIDSNTSSNRSSFMPFESDSHGEQSQPKCSSVIGSEMKNVLQRRKEQEFAHLDPYQYSMRSSSSQYSHFGGSGVNFNQNNAASCDENYMHRPNNYQSYPSQSINYDDLRLQPGKMLNSEVTIHNVTESKFFQNQTKAQAPIGTPRNLIADITTTPKLFGDLLIQPTLLSRPHAPPAENGNF